MLSLRPLLTGSHLFAVLFGSTVDTFYVSLQWLVGGVDKVCLHFVVQRQVPGCPDIPVVAQRQFPMVQLFMLMVQFSDKVVVVPVVGQRQVPQFRSCSSSTVVDTPVFA